jgi:hypothetical protein
MADEGIQHGAPAPVPVPPPPETPPRPGGPGTAADTVTLARVPPSKAPVAKPAPAQPEMKDSFREIIETIVFVVVLVLMLKTFLAEAFVIPTGSMAVTLLGYHKDVTCEKCGYDFKVNASSEAEAQPGRDKEDVLTADCPNCRYRNVIAGIRGGRQ